MATTPAPSRPGAPPPIPARTFQPKRRRRYVKVIAIALVGLVVLGAAASIVRSVARQRAHEDAVQMLAARMELEQKDSMHADTWQGGISIDGTNYMLMSFREENTYAKEFLQTLSPPVSALVMFIDNRGSERRHSVDLSGAKLHLAGNVIRDAPDQLQVLQSATTNRDAAIEAFSQVIKVPPETILWGKLLCIPADIDLHKLLAVSITINGKPQILDGGFFTAEQKRGFTQ